jgi:hypothetical protein
LVRAGARSRALVAAATITAGGAGCDHLSEPLLCLPVEFLSRTVAANPHNVLSAVVAVRTRRADSILIRFGTVGGTLDSATPSTPVADDETVVPVLGLVPETVYALQVVAHGACGAESGPMLAFTTGSLPEDLPHYSAGGASPSSGYVVFSAGAYGIVIDNSGRVVWYRRFPQGPGLNFQPLPTGRYAARPMPPVPGGTGFWVELDPLGEVTRSFGCARGLIPRFHDVIAELDGSHWLMCDETRMVDLSAVGGVAEARVTGTVVQHLGPSGSLLFEWSPFDHFDITDLDPAERTGADVNWTHGNAIDLDHDGNLLVSFRNLSEITKIDTRTGHVRWRMGGPRNQFTFQNTTMPPFARQHGVRVLGPGNLVLLDNLGEIGGSRAERYEYDEVRLMARQSAVFGGGSSVVASVGGTTQPLPGERTLVSYGTGGRVEEYDADGNVVWRIDGTAGYVFRAQRIRSLYQPGADLPR